MGQQMLAYMSFANNFFLIMVDRRGYYIERGDAMSRTVKLICLDLIILYLIGRMPFPLLVIPLVGCMVIHNINEIREIRNEQKNSKRHKKVTKKSTKK